jgi:hypothetical protein
LAIFYGLPITYPVPETQDITVDKKKKVSSFTELLVQWKGKIISMQHKDRTYRSKALRQGAHLIQVMRRFLNEGVFDLIPG